MKERLAFGFGSRRDAVPAAVSGASASSTQPTQGGPPSRPDVGSVASARRLAPAEPRDWAFTWTLIFTAVLFLRPQDVIAPLEFLHLAELSAIAGLTALFFSRLSRGQPITRMTPEFMGVIALGGVILLTAPFSIWIGGSIKVFTDLYVKVILVYLLAVNVIDSPRRLERLTWLLVLSVGYLGFRAVLDYARGVNMVARGTRVAGAVGGIMQNPNDLALNMVALLPLAAFMAMRPGSPVRRLVAAFCGVFMLGAIVASGSRGGFIGFCAMVVALGVFVARQRPIVVVAGMMAVMCALPLAPSSYWRRIASITDSSKDDYQSSEARRELFGESFDAFVQNPLTGVGAGEFKDWNPRGRTQAWHESHNVWLQVAAELGILGVAVMAFLVSRGFLAVVQTRRLLKRLRPPPSRRRRVPTGPGPEPSAVLSEYEATLLDALSAAMMASLVGWLACSLFASVAYNWTFYYLLVLAAAPRDILRARMAPVTPTRRSSPAASRLVRSLGTEVGA